MMRKRRRERDKPKVAPDAPYNPHKRVLLSYASDEEDDGGLEEKVDAGRPRDVDAASTNYQIPSYPDEEEQDGLQEGDVEYVLATAEGDDADEADTAADGDKDQLNQSGAFFRSVSKNQSTNQCPALGSLSYQWDEDDGEASANDSDEAEAMAYLRAVRSERQNLPTVLHAPHRDENEELYESGIGDGRGHLSDGTYVGRPGIGPTIPEAEKTTISPQEAFTRELKERFLTQREQMHISPGAEALAKLGDKHPITFPEGSNKAYAEWQRLLRTVAPQPAQMRAMDIDTVMRLLALAQRLYLVREKHVHKLTSAWVWSLLARLDDVGTMNSDEVYFVREFGKKAILVQLSFSDPLAARQLEEVDLEGKAGTFTEASPAICEKDIQNGIEKPNGTANDEAAKQNTLATLDVIITIVGEVFGQRDLLEFRSQWQAADDVTIANTE